MTVAVNLLLRGVVQPDYRLVPTSRYCMDTQPVVDLRSLFNPSGNSLVGMTLLRNQTTYSENFIGFISPRIYPALRTGLYMAEGWRNANQASSHDSQI